MEHEFTPVIVEILKKDFKKQAEDIYKMSLLIQYLNIKTRSASRGSKARSSFGVTVHYPGSSLGAWRLLR